MFIVSNKCVQWKSDQGAPMGAPGREMSVKGE